jgi:CubicO group peptidase (beta-lactamase class C family)
MKYESLANFDPNLDRVIRRIVADAGVPGAAVAISLSGQNVVGCFGATDATATDSVNPDTAFDMGSCSKAFVTTAVALLASEGRLDLERPVIDYLPDFELDEARVTASVTVRDLMCNRIGLRRQIPGTAYSNPEIPARRILRRLRHMDRVAEFRNGYVYFNPGFMAAAQVVEAVTGTRYSDFLERSLLSALGMHHTASGPRVAKNLRKSAIGHTFVDGRPVPLQATMYENLEGAAAVYTSAIDSLRWMKFHLNGGRVDGDEVVNEEFLAQTHAPHNRIPDAECKLIHKPPEARHCDYCMGWWLTELHGTPLLQHAGEAVGWRAMIALLPERQIGVAAFLSAGKSVHQAITYTILETLLTGGARDWNALAIAEQDSLAAQIGEQTARAFPCSPGAPLSVPLDRLAGTYRHDACGDVLISRAGRALDMRFADGRLWDIQMEHLGDDVFECRLRRPEARDFMAGTWRARFEVFDGAPAWLDDFNARYRRVA